MSEATLRDPHALARAIAAWTRAQVERAVERYLPDLRLPRTFAGYPVGADVRADLAFTIGLLDASGEGAIAGRSAAESLRILLRAIDGPGTHTFFSYRVAETLARAGRFDDHPWLGGFSDAERASVAEACDSTAWCALLESGRLPANYAAVLARCEVARRRLGLAIDPALLDRLLERTAALLARHPRGWHDDSPAGAGRYDIYTADLYLFLEPLADDPALAPLLAAPWERGMRSAIELVEKVGARSGAAFPWGRSTGALAVCLTIELGALALARGFGSSRALWLERVAGAFEGFAGWMGDGLIAAHQHRSPYSYRGPERRLQMTFDCLGKLAWAAAELGRAPGGAIEIAPDDAFPPCDELIELGTAPRAAVWAHRGRSLAFALPLVGASLNDYLPAPQAPGLLEVPVEIDLPAGVPFALRHGRRYAPCGPPDAIERGDGGLGVRWDRLPRTAEWDVGAETPALAGSYAAEIDARGGRLVTRARIALEEPPDAIALQVAESARRRLRVEFACSRPHAVTVIETAGVKEYRSFWGEIARVHQIDVEPAREVELAWTVAPVLRVATTASHHHYDRAVYEPLAGRIEREQFPFEWLQEPGRASEAFLDGLDLFHLHWPEWTTHDPAAHRLLVERLRAHRVRVVWTQHNLVPHTRDPALAALYPLWAAAADGVIHHSAWGEARVREAFPFRPDAIHRVIPHPHFGHLAAATLADAGERRRARAEVEGELGLRPCAIRLGVVGAPRPEKDLQLLLDAFAACRRDDLGLLVLSLGSSERVPADPRVVALPYEMVAREVYDRRLAAIDALVFPIRAGELLTSGVVGDAIAAGLPSIVSDWPYLTEALGAGALRYGATVADLTAFLDRLSAADLARAAAGAGALRDACSSERVAELTLALLDEIGSAKL